MEGLEVRELNRHEDHRGWLAEIMRSDEADFSPAMSYLSMTRPGLVRGPHEHREQTDYFCFVGRFRLYLWDNRKRSRTYKTHKTVDTSDAPTVARIPPGIVHAYRNMDERDGLVINLPDRLYRGRAKKDPVDEIRYEDAPDSPYRIED